jgi:hypothetical protein
MKTKPVPLKHHHLPVFYLHRWTGEDGRLCQFSRPYKEIVPKRLHPEQTGFVERLYELKGLPQDQAQKIEQFFMQPLDTSAAEALVMLENDDPRMKTDGEARSAWSLFIMSLLMRSPEDIEALKLAIADEWTRSVPELEIKYAARRGQNDPPTFQVYLAQCDSSYVERWAMTLLPKLIDHRMIGELLNKMRWIVRSFPSEAGELLTSDCPVIMSATLSEQNAYLFLPISPNRLFVAVNDIETQQRVVLRDPAEQVDAVNQYVVGGAVKFVYGHDDRILAYVQEHMGTKPRKRLIDRLAASRKTGI